MTHSTKGIILRTIRYGETSLVVTIFTELFGVQAYMVNGIRSAKKTGLKAAMYQPSAILDLEVYHNDLKAMHRIREANWSLLYQHILTDVVRNSIAVFMMELLYKTLRQPEQNTDLFYFTEDCLLHLDREEKGVVANMALFFTLQLAHFFGLRLENAPPAYLQDEEPFYLDLQEGYFTCDAPPHALVLEGQLARLTAELLQVTHPSDLNQVTMNHLQRRELIGKYLEFYTLHVPDFGQMKTLSIMQEVLG